MNTFLNSADKHDVIQVNEKVAGWVGCLMVVDEVRDWGVIAYMTVPYNGVTFLRLKHDEYELIGNAEIVRVSEEVE